MLFFVGLSLGLFVWVCQLIAALHQGPLSVKTTLFFKTLVCKPLLTVSSFVSLFIVLMALIFKITLD